MQKTIQHFIHHSSASKKQKQIAIFFAILLFMLSLFALYFSGQELKKMLVFIPLYTTAVIILNTITMYLLFSEFIVSRSPALAVLASAYLFAGLLAPAYLLTFPGIFSKTGLLYANEQTAAWLRVFWQIGFSIYVLVYIQINKRFDKQLQHKQVHTWLINSILITVGIVAALIFLTISKTNLLPNIIYNGNYISATSTVGLSILFVDVLVLILFLFQKKEKSIIDIWLLLTIFTALLGSSLSLYANVRFSFGWYSARIITTISTSIVLSALLIEIRRLYNTISEQEYIFRMVFESSVIGIVRTDLHRNILEANESFYKISDYSGNEMTNLLQSSFMPETDWPTAQSIDEKLFSGEQDKYQLEKHYLGNNNTTIWVNIIVSLVRKTNNQPESFLFMIEDITERKIQEEKIYFQAYHDSLTGLLKRNAFTTQLNLAIESAKEKSTKFSIMFFDLDGFKEVNDTFGHGVGDLLLKSVADRFLSITRKEDIFARIGGDEFTALFPNIQDIADLRKLAERFSELFTSPFEIEGNEIFVTVSIGISIYPYHGDTEKELITCADTAMYKAKYNGKNRYVLFDLEEA